MQDKGEVAKMHKKMKTVCVGRFLIDLPSEAEVSLSRAFIQGFNISTVTETADEFRGRLAARETELNAAKNQLGRKNLESVKKIGEGGLVGKIFVYGRWRTDWTEDGAQKHVEGVLANAYVHADGISYDFTTEGYDPERVDNLSRLISQLRPNPRNVVPELPGFCIDRGMFVDPLVAEQGERVSMFAGLPGHPDLAIVFSTMAGTRSGPGLLARNAESAAKEPFFVRAAFTNLREQNRTINGLAGEELVMRVREPNFTTGFTFDWEMGGKENDVFTPLLTLELRTGISSRPGAKPVQSSLSQDALIDLWDKISSSIRIRPANPPAKISAVEPVVPPLGTFVTAGDTCPQTGWWQCREGGDGVGVLGGQRQYLRKGQKMPQALLLPPQTLWQKVRGLQPSYESNTPTSWELVDKRRQVRVEPHVALAQAMPPGGLDPTAVAAEDALMERAPVGSFVKTGVACPASGWWHCEEPHALDGTRWFAYGSLLPPATFKVPSGAFGKSAGHLDVIQRRSLWQLVRYAEAPNQVVDAESPSDDSGDANEPGAADSDTPLA